MQLWTDSASLRDRAALVGEDGIKHGFGPLEGIMVPRGSPYAFRNAGIEPLRAQSTHVAILSRVSAVTTDARFGSDELGGFL